MVRQSPSGKARLGDILRTKGAITSETLDAALAQQKREPAPLGHILTAKGHTSPSTLAEAVAAQHNVRYVDTRREPCDPLLLNPAHREAYTRYHVLPWRKTGAVITYITPHLTMEAVRWLARQHPQGGFELALTGARDIPWCLNQAFSRQYTQSAQWGRHWRTPEYSAYHTFMGSAAQMLTMGLAALALLYLLLSPAGKPWLFGAAAALFAISLLFKVLITAVGRIPMPAVAETLPKRLPVYSILVPLYHETRSIPGLIQALENLDYPKTKLDVKFIVEADDGETMAAIHSARPPGFIEVVRVPPSLPRTKPKACNYALPFVKGEYVTIYDAEDRPHPRQLKEALSHFAQSGEDVACLQARLNYYNREENLLTRLFSMEYALWFDAMLPGLERLGLPIPLGGTSNHVRAAALAEAGEWDPFNVTEDADLGMHLAVKGYRTRVLNSLTLEEAPIQLAAWMKQRTRWIKGYLQTYLVYMRNPLKLLRTLGLRRFTGFQLFIGGPCFVFLAAPWMWLLSLMGMVKPWMLPSWVVGMSVWNLALCVGIHWVMGLWICRRNGWRNMAAAIAFFPFYWLLHSIAGMRALWQLFTAPHRWEKTEHGVSRISWQPDGAGHKGVDTAVASG